jgi:hypothetical protein
MTLFDADHFFHDKMDVLSSCIKTTKRLSNKRESGVMFPAIIFIDQRYMSYPNAIMVLIKYNSELISRRKELHFLVDSTKR